MLAELAFPLFPEQASTTAARVDALMFFLLAVSVVMSLLIAALLIYFAVKYRRRPGNERSTPVAGSLKLEICWSAVPLVVGLIAFVWSVDVYFYITRPPADAMEIYVVGKQWMWKLQHLEGQREINELHVPLNKPVRLTLTSEDVIHDLFVPAFRTKVDVLPNRYVQSWFQATKTGRFHFFCSQYCGTGHSQMIGTVVVMKPEDYQAWLDHHAEGSMALEGRKRFFKYECVSCHSADAAARAPVLEELYGRPVALNNGRTVTADDNYLRESIVLPDAKIVAGYEPIMPSFEGQIEAEEINELMVFMKSLKRGETPRRIDTAPAPVADRSKTADSKKQDSSHEQ